MSGTNPADEMSTEDSRKVCEVGHEDRQELDALLNKPRDVQALKDFKMKIVLGPGKVKRTSLRELEEEYKTTEEGQLLLNGGSLTVPVVDYVKDKFKLKSVETLERMERELMRLHDELVGKGFSQEEVTRLVTRDKEVIERVDPETAKRAIELYTKYQKLRSEMAEVEVKQARGEYSIRERT